MLIVIGYNQYLFVNRGQDAAETLKGFQTQLYNAAIAIKMLPKSRVVFPRH